MMLVLAAVAAAKLVIVTGSTQPTVITYPTLARCEAAKKALLAQDAAYAAQQRAKSTIAVPYVRQGVAAYCIPG